MSLIKRDILDETGKDGVYSGFPFGRDAIGTNLYAWCKNNPVTKIDPSGMGLFEDLLAIAGAAAGYLLGGIPGAQAGAAIGAAVGGVIDGIVNQIGGSINEALDNLGDTLSNFTDPILNILIPPPPPTVVPSVIVVDGITMTNALLFQHGSQEQIAAYLNMYPNPPDNLEDCASFGIQVVGLTAGKKAVNSKGLTAGLAINASSKIRAGGILYDLTSDDPWYEKTWRTTANILSAIPGFESLASGPALAKDGYNCLSPTTADMS